MYLIYIDESGKPSYNDPNDYVLSAIIVHETNWERVYDSVNVIKKTYFPKNNPDKVELHTNEINAGKGFFKGIPPEERNKILCLIAETILLNDLEIVSVLINKKAVRKENQNSDFVELWAWRLLFERLEQCISPSSDPWIKIKDYGLICMDSENPQADNRIREKLRFFRKNGSHYVKNRSLIEDPFFVKSSYTNLVQLADFTAWVIRRRHSGLNNPKVDILVDKLYKKISKKFHKSGGKISGFGLKIFPK